MCTLTSKKGQSLAEYGLILALVALVAIVGLGQLGGTINDKFKEVDSKLKGPSTSSTTPQAP